MLSRSLGQNFNWLRRQSCVIGIEGAKRPPGVKVDHKHDVDKAAENPRLGPQRGRVERPQR